MVKEAKTAHSASSTARGLTNQAASRGPEYRTKYFYDTADNSLKTSITDTTAGSVSLDCGRQYRVEVISTSGAAGDSSWLVGSSLGKSDGDGNIVFNACGVGSTFTVQSYQHGTVETRAYDVMNNGFMFDNSGAAASSYVGGTSANFTSTTNGTAQAIGTSGEMHVKQYVRAAASDEAITDRGMYLLIDANTNKWQTPTVIVNGQTLQNIKGTLPADAAIAYTDYEYAFLIPQTILGDQQHEINLILFPTPRRIFQHSQESIIIGEPKGRGTKRPK